MKVTKLIKFIIPLLPWRVDFCGHPDLSSGAAWKVIKLKKVTLCMSTEGGPSMF